MGRKTWESLPGILPERRHLVMTRGNRDDIETTTFEEVIKLSNEQNVFVIGGGEIYCLFLPHIEKIYRTIIHCNVEQPDTFAPELDEDIFSVIETKFVEKSDKDQYDMTFEVLVKTN